MARSGAAELQLVIQETGGTSTGIRRTGDDLNPPEDRQNRVYIALLLCGVGLLLPYNRCACTAVNRELYCCTVVEYYGSFF